MERGYLPARIVRSLLALVVRLDRRKRSVGRSCMCLKIGSEFGNFSSYFVVAVDGGAECDTCNNGVEYVES